MIKRETERERERKREKEKKRERERLRQERQNERERGREREREHASTAEKYMGPKKELKNACMSTPGRALSREALFLVTIKKRI